MIMMRTMLFQCTIVAGVLIYSVADGRADDVLTVVKNKADLDTLIIGSDGPKKLALQKHAAAILKAASIKPNADEVIATLEKASGSYEKINTTPEDLKQALGQGSSLFDSLKMVNLASTALDIKAKRLIDPFDSAFYQRLGEIPQLEALTILHTTAQNDWLIPLGKLSSLKSLNIINQSKLNDEGLAHLAGLKQLERLGYIGTSMTGKPFQQFKDWTNLKSCSFRGSKIDDEGLQALCEAFPNLESLVLAHANFTDAAAVRLAQLKKLKGLEIGTRKATPKCLLNIVSLPLEYLQLGDGLDASDGIAIIKDVKTLKRLTLTNCKTMNDADLKAVAGMKQLQQLEMNSLDLPDERLPLLKEFSFLKSLKLVRREKPYSQDTRDKIAKLLPSLSVKFE